MLVKLLKPLIWSIAHILHRDGGQLWVYLPEVLQEGKSFPGGGPYPLCVPSP